MQKLKTLLFAGMLAIAINSLALAQQKDGVAKDVKPES
jgi:hypothetical protein